MVDPRDLGLVSQVRSPHNQSPTVYLYEAVPGGVGLSERLFDRHDELIAGAADLLAGCGCASGCPSCTGPRLEPDVDAKALALRLLRTLVRGESAARGEAPAYRESGLRGPAPVTEVPGAAA
jgi:DEAD/DEAH box helicase domain-containing protein